ncbi:MAG: hypothetical protein HRU33_18940 [Rhodobacteraceae bacterium]|nr:hypothetical protein [Paracoccaceae bacterium]
MDDFDKIEDMDQLESWLQTQDPRMSRAIAARASLRSLPVAMAEVDNNFGSLNGQGLLLSCFRATLITGVASTCRTPVMKKVNSAAFSAAITTGYRFDPAHSSVALSVAISATTTTTSDSAHSADSAVRSAVNSANAIALAVYSVSNLGTPLINFTNSVVRADARARQNGNHVEMFKRPLWPSTDHIGPLLGYWEGFAAHPDPDETWAFWRDWYQSMLEGKPLDWDLQLQVALIKDAVWEEGAEAVAREIKSIRGIFGSADAQIQDRFPVYEPKSVHHLIENKVVISANLNSCSFQISQAIAGFRKETLENRLPDRFLPLEDIPALMQSVAGSLQKTSVNTASEHFLIEKVGRLKGKVAELEEQLELLKRTKPDELSERERKNYSAFLRNGFLAVCSVTGILYMLSGDEIGPEKREENLIHLGEFLMSKFGAETNAPIDL